MKNFLFIIFLMLCSINCKAQEEPDFNRNLILYQSGMFEDAFNAFSRSAQFHQNIKSQYYLAECYFKGRGVEKDDKKAFQLYRKLAEKGLPVAQAKLAYCLYKGLGSPKDTSKANYWMEKAVFYENVDAYTLYVLGMCYEEGLGRDQDVQKAMELYSQALSRGVDEAYVHLSSLLYTGGVIRKDVQESLRIINEAIASIGSVDDYTCKGAILVGIGNDKENLDNWQTIQKKYPYFALHSNDEYCLSQRSLNPIPENIIAEAVKQTENKEELKGTATDNLSLAVNNVINNITIKYEVVQTAPSQQSTQQNQTPQPEVKPNVVQVESSKPKSDVDQNLPASNQTNEQTFALIIANENYQDVTKVPNALNDGEIFAEYCKKVLGLPNSNVHFVKDATLSNIKREMNLMNQIAEAYTGNAKFIIYYAGHGIPDESSKNAYLLPVDGYTADLTTCFGLNEFYGALGKLSSPQIVVLLDACFSGSLRGEGMLASARGVAIKAKSGVPSGKMIVFSAAQGDETAYPYSDQGHGLFTYYLLKKLKETNGQTNLGDLADFIRENVIKKSLVVNGKQQTPTVQPSAASTDWRNWKLK